MTLHEDVGDGAAEEATSREHRCDEGECCVGHRYACRQTMGKRRWGSSTGQCGLNLIQGRGVITILKIKEDECPQQRRVKVAYLEGCYKDPVTNQPAVGRERELGCRHNVSRVAAGNTNTVLYRSVQHTPLQSEYSSTSTNDVSGLLATCSGPAGLFQMPLRALACL